LPLPLPLALALVLIAGVAAIPAVKLGWRRLLLTRAREPGDRALAAYRRMTAEAADLGFPRSAAETPAEYRDRLRLRVSTLDGELDRLTGITARAAYSGTGISPIEADEAVHSAERVAREIRRAGGARRRLAGLFRVSRGSSSRLA
jgi:hypothetical protein